MFNLAWRLNKIYVKISAESKKYKLAPVALFVYNRPNHMLKTIAALQKNDLAEDTELFIFSDGPKSQNDVEKVQEVREIIKNIHGFKTVTIKEQEKNLGLANSIITGVSSVIEKYDKVIVLEDDMITSKYFLRYMNEALNLYEKNERVISIHGYVYPIKGELPETFFLKGADCWGWATWKRGWDLFEPDGKKLLAELRASRQEKRFDFNGSYGYTQMLEDQVNGKNDSWAIRWYASAFLKDKLTLYPGKSLVHNIGFDGSGVHCGNSQMFDNEVATKPVSFASPIPIKENEEMFLKFEKFFRGVPDTEIKKPKAGEKVKDKLKNCIKLLLPMFMLQLYHAYKAKEIPDLSEEESRPKPKYGFFGNYATWEEAKQESTGYDADLILEKVKEAILKVKNGQAVYERDSVLFDKIQYSWPLLAGLLWVASNCENRLNLIDFGGSLGSSYFQNRSFLLHLKELHWNVIEQPKFVTFGQENIADNYLHFYYTIEDCLKEQKPDLILFSSVLQYIEDPYALLKQVISYNFKFIILDRTTVLEQETDRITVQKVMPHIYEASYPARFFGLEKLLKVFTEKYELVADFDALGDTVELEDIIAFDKGFIFKLKTNDTNGSEKR